MNIEFRRFVDKSCFGRVGGISIKVGVGSVVWMLEVGVW